MKFYRVVTLGLLSSVAVCQVTFAMESLLRERSQHKQKEQEQQNVKIGEAKDEEITHPQVIIKVSKYTDVVSCCSAVCNALRKAILGITPH